MESGKRRHLRCDFSQIITYSLLPQTDDKVLTGLLHDFSYSGLCIITYEPIQESQEILLKTGITKTSITAVARWCSNMGNSTYEVGLEFKN